MATQNGQLNAEPADAQARKEQHLVPKSFADAVQEDLPVQKENSTSVNGAKPDKDVEANGNTNGHGASVLRIVNTHGESNGKTNGNVVSETVGTKSRPGIEREESTHEYEAAVIKKPQFRGL